MILYKGKKIYEGDELPMQPRGSRVLVRPDPPEDRSAGGLHVPDIAQQRGNKGTILAAGLAALDQMEDHCDQPGDRVLFGRLAGIWEEWDHITEPGKKGCKHEEWLRAPTVIDRTSAFKCSTCGAQRLQEPLLLMDADDMQANIDLAERMNRREVNYKNIDTTGVRTQYRYTTPKKERKAS
jgi:chaperonin GroES